MSGLQLLLLFGCIKRLIFIIIIIIIFIIFIILFLKSETFVSGLF